VSGLAAHGNRASSVLYRLTFAGCSGEPQMLLATLTMPDYNHSPARNHPGKK
jgi:hypothetical protein